MLINFRTPQPEWGKIVARALRWLVRIALLWTLITAFKPAPPRAPLMPPQTVETTQPRLCLHTRLIDEVDEWKIQRSLIMARELGARTIVEFFPWAYIEGARGQYYWGQADRIIRHAQNQGLRVIARMGYVPAWARGDTREALTTLNTLPPAVYADFAAFVAAFAARYAGTVDQIIIWNEPNLAFEWGYQAVDPAGYARLLQAVYAPAHAANPNVVILAAGLAPTLEPRGSPHGLDDLLYLDDLYAAGAGAYFDALAVHTYGFTQPPDAAPAPDRVNFRRAELLRDIMTRYGDDAPVYITETGWNDHPRWVGAVTPPERVRYTLSAYAWAESSWPWLEATCLWQFATPWQSYNYVDNYTFVAPDGTPKAIYYAVQQWTHGE